MTWLRARTALVLFLASLGLLAAGGVAWVLDARDAATWSWVAGAVLGLAMSVASTVVAARRRQPTVDVIAVLALAGALAVDEPFAGAMITVMLASGQLLEARASARARRELGLLVARAPRTARLRSGDAVQEVAVDDVLRGDHLVVGTGEVVPVDGRLLTPGILDESALTGEPLPVERPAGDEVRSGVVNAGPPLELLATSVAAESTYAGVVRLVEQAQASSAPFVRTADRFAVLFVPLTLALAVAAWALAGDPVRAVAVLVVATPCPLLLAAPIAVMSGLSRAARRGVVIKGGAALERLASGRVVLFDKTGTLTQGRPTVSGVVTAGDVDADTLLRLAASLDQLSAHVLADAIVAAARRRGLPLTIPSDIVEEHGYGVSGTVEGQAVRLGKADWVVPERMPSWGRQVRRRADLDGSMTVFVSVDGRPAGAVLLEDPIRPDAPRMVRALRAAGLDRVVLVTGDRADVAGTVGRIVGVDTVLADCDPADKLAAIRAESEAAPTIMVGDGINDAPALAAAGVGVALAARGATASSEAADVVLTVDRVDALADADPHRPPFEADRPPGRRSSGWACPWWPWSPPPPASSPQRSARCCRRASTSSPSASPSAPCTPGRVHTVAMPAEDVALARRLRADHDATLAAVEQIRAVADALSTEVPDLAPARRLLGHLETTVVPHEREEEQLLVPLVSRALGGHEATAALSRTHAEIEHQVGRLRRLLADLDDDTAETEDVVELRRLLYGLYAVLRLHNAQEEEGAFALVPAEAAAEARGAAR